jgi:hypothetical protein
VPKRLQSDLTGILGKGSGVSYDDRTEDALHEVDLLESFLSGYVSQPRDERSGDAATLVIRQFEMARRCIDKSPRNEITRRLAEYVAALEGAYERDR